MAQASGSVPGAKHGEVCSRGCELFVGGLSRSVSENLIEKLFSPYGEILELRMMKDQNGISKGFCFVRFATKEAAYKAIKGRDGYMLNGKKIGVARSSDQDTLFLGNLSKVWSLNEFDNLVRRSFKDVLSVDLAFPSNNEEAIAGRKHLNRGFGFVQFSSHAVMTESKIVARTGTTGSTMMLITHMETIYRDTGNPTIVIMYDTFPFVKAAARAHRLASEPDFYLGDVHPAAEWAEKEREIDPDELAKIRVAFVGNLPADADEEFLKGLFEPFGKLDKVAISRKSHFPVGFVHFARRSDLDNAIRKLDGKMVSGPGRSPGFQIQVSVAKPPTEKGRKRTHEEMTSPKGRPDVSHVMNGGRHDPSSRYRPRTPKFEDAVLDVVDPYEEAVISLPMAVKDRLLQILRLGIATRYDIDLECISGLKELPVAAAIAVINQFMLSGRDKRNKGDYFLSLIAMHQGRRTGVVGPRLDSRNSLDIALEKQGIPSSYGRRPIGSFSTRHDRHPSPTNVALASQASPPYEHLSSRTVIRVPRKRSPEYEAMPSSAPVSRNRARLDAMLSLAAEHPSERPQYKFDPFTGQPYKFDPFTGEPIQPEAGSRRTGGYY